MELFRLSRKKFAMPLSGKGAALKGARWNSPGVELVYTAMNRSLAMAEVAVHLTFATLPTDYVMMTIEVPDDIKAKTLAGKDLPPNWKKFPHPSSTQRIGDGFVAENRFCLLVIPSVVTQGDFNVLINPHHRDFKRVKVKKVEKFPFDGRLFS